MSDELEQVVWRGQTWAVPVVDCHGNHCHLTLTNPQDAVEVPRLPTRSEVRDAIFDCFADKETARNVEEVLIGEGWAVEDPEPEVDPAQVEALRKLLAVDSLEDDGALDEVARRLLASGRVSVKVDG